ncbi:ABC transporter ATP-binding protein [Pseudonocardia humida]|uniref:ABC transporter ATP-binding protein n=1 Tax=Pseudonocardia humida TaxID=2800819 RepID=A0ABT1A6E1_9PSEU|nr:ABC transporter ATP-binding protein [Pseudonocardia humida]MCO1658585.1 ABC transporter ATP-binding protein [Pseudonocardia humida]
MSGTDGAQPAPGVRLPLATGREVRRVIGTYVRDRRGPAVATVALAALASAAGLVAPWAVGRIVDTVLTGGEPGAVVASAVLVGAAGLLGAVLTAVSAALVVRIGQHVLARLREQTVSSALRLPAGELEESGRGDLLSRVGDDVGVVADVVTRLLAPLVGALLTVALTVAGLVALDPWLAVAGLTALPVYALSLRWYLPRAGRRYAAERAAFADRAEALVSTLDGLRTVRAYGAETAHAERITASSARARDISRDVLWFGTAWGKWMNIAELVGLASIVAVGFAVVAAGTATVGEVTAAALYFHRMFNPIGMIMMSFDELQSAVASLSRIVGVVTAAPEPTPAPAQRPTGEVLARGVSHRYASAEVLHDVTVALAAGERVALVGPSGAGKSTLAVLLAGLAAPSAGEVTVGGTPVERFGSASPKPVVLVSQEAHVFAGPLADDLRLARPDATDDEIERALKTTGADAWVAALPQGARTVVGELGHSLTPEQAAQVALARALLADPVVVVLDEATAESGSRSATRLEDAADAVLDGRTGLVVAHRLRQASRADRILVMADGRVVEAGSHEELLAAGGHYAELWAAWQV